MIGNIAMHLLAALVMPVVMLGVINRTKSLWSGRRGQRIFQLAFDLVRLLRKRPVYGTATSPLFRIAPWVFLATTAGSAFLVPLLGVRPYAGFPLDFVWFLYVWGLGRVALVLAALDTGSAFEGMGAARESVFASLLEPVLFLVAGALVGFAEGSSLYDAVALPWHGGASIVVWTGAVVALWIALQVESGRMPVDDPTTHLELTMVHEVMILDHSGPELAAIQFGSALKLYLGASLLAVLLAPRSLEPWPLAAAVHVALCLLVAVALGTFESLTARWRIRTVPLYVSVALVAGVVVVLATAWRGGGAR